MKLVSTKVLVNSMCIVKTYMDVISWFCLCLLSAIKHATVMLILGSSEFNVPIKVYNINLYYACTMNKF